MNIQRIICAVFVFCLSFGFGFLARTEAALQLLAVNEPNVLKQKIEEKNATLQNIQEQREILEQNLDEINKSQNSLKKELKAIDTNINQLNLSTKEKTVLIEKLGFETESLKDEIVKAGESIDRKRVAIEKLLVELQERERTGILSILLTKTTLSDNFTEINRITDLNEGLKSGIVNLQNLQEDIRDKIEKTINNKERQRIEQINLENKKLLIQEQKTEKQQILEETKNREDLYQQKLTELEKMQMEISGEIEEIETELRKKIDPNLIPVARQIFLWPIIGGLKTQDYGKTKFALRNYKGGRHNGIDIGSPIGTEILAAESGRIISAGDQDKYCRKGSYGKFVVIKHKNGLSTLYGHLSKYIVAIGQSVERGQVIGYVGSTGYATGPHLHLTLFANSTLSPSRPGYPEGTQPSRSCGPMPVGGDMDPDDYF
ncbi:MAG: peptidoglycan DD-metalloendopeptidase family protein [Patescibacteria group bacterium]